MSTKAEERERKRAEKLAAEQKRMEQMLSYEREYWANYDIICGVDEAGRGPFAGPIVAAAVILPKDDVILYLNDSKKLSEKKREELFAEIQQRAVSVGVGIVDAKQIDEMGVGKADFLAMRQAIAGLSPQPDFAFTDAFEIPELEILQLPIVKGDAKSASIAAASIIAKVTRDRMMVEYDAEYPEYGFAKHKGYGTAYHREMITEHGPCPIHRMSFLGNMHESWKK